MSENEAILTIEKAGSKSFVYKGSDPAWKERTGRFSILYDMNCCAPTDGVLFEFDSDGLRKIMDARGFGEFYADCAAVEEE